MKKHRPSAMWKKLEDMGEDTFVELTIKCKLIEIEHDAYGDGGEWATFEVDSQCDDLMLPLNKIAKIEGRGAPEPKKDGTVVIDSRGVSFQRVDGSWYTAANPEPISWSSITKPKTVWNPDD
jgi:hypothetical protein